MSKFTANRVVLILHGAFVVLTAAGVFVATVSHSLPVAWQTTLAAAVTILGALAAATVAVTKFLDGSQKFDALHAGGVAPVAVPSSDDLEQGPDLNDGPARTREPVIAVTP